jgi:hypothetical protein
MRWRSGNNVETGIRGQPLYVPVERPVDNPWINCGKTVDDRSEKPVDLLCKSLGKELSS